MKVLVTGGAGFIGSHLVDALVKQGAKVRVFDNLSTGKKANLSSAWSRIDFIRGDLLDPKALQRALEGVETVFHQAALRSVPRSVEDPQSTHEVNSTGTLLLLMLCRKAKVKRVIYASSSSVYGDNRQYPQGEDLRPSPLSPYAVSKLTGELYGTVFSKIFGVETVSLRYFNVFGPRQDPQSQYAAVIPKFMKAAVCDEPLEVHWDGRQARDFTYIDNVVYGNILAARVPHVSGEVFNIACGKSYSILQIVKSLEKLLCKSLFIHPMPKRAGDVRKTWADIRKAKRRLRYSVLVDFEEGIKRMWSWFVQHHSDPSYQ